MNKLTTVYAHCVVALLEGALGCWHLWDFHLEDLEIAKINLTGCSPLNLEYFGFA